MIEVIYTVETGQYSSHTIEAFCTTVDEARRVAARVFEKQNQIYECSINSWGSPVIYANPVNTLDGFARRIRWHKDENIADEQALSDAAREAEQS